MSITANLNQYGEAATSNCRGSNHHDHATLGECDSCGARVAKIEDGRIADVHSNNYGNPAYYCFERHTCTEVDKARKAAADFALAALGNIVKGFDVEVIKGRKVALGTIGTVIWTGIDSYGKRRIGIACEDGTKHFLAAANVKVVA